ncbi:MAG: hypothetical protein WCJ18_00285 [Planctomycetota bacterium]
MKCVNCGQELTTSASAGFVHTANGAMTCGLDSEWALATPAAPDDGQDSLFDNPEPKVEHAESSTVAGFDQHGSLAAAQVWLRAQLTEGAPCPCCTQFAKLYRRKINSAMARALIHQYRKVRCDYAQTTRLCPWTHEAAQLSWWGLLEEEPIRRDDGGRSSWWRVTESGVAFALNQLRVPKYAVVYDGRLQRMDKAEYVDIRGCLGTRFSYEELMSS